MLHREGMKKKKKLTCGFVGRKFWAFFLIITFIPDMDQWEGMKTERKKKR